MTRVGARLDPYVTALPNPFQMASNELDKLIVSKSKEPVQAYRLLFCYLYWLTHTAGHFELDQAIQFDRVFHRQFFGNWLNETVDDQ